MDYREWDKVDWFTPTTAAYLWCGVPPLSEEERKCIEDMISAIRVAIEDERLYAYAEHPTCPGELTQAKPVDNVDVVQLHRRDLRKWSKLDHYPTPFLNRKLRKKMQPPKECADRIRTLATEVIKCQKESTRLQSVNKQLTDKNANLSARIRTLLELVDEHKNITKDLRNSIEQLQRENEKLRAENEGLTTETANSKITITELNKKSKDTGLPHCQRHRDMLKAALYVLHNPIFRKEYLTRAKGRTDGTNCAALAKTIEHHGHALGLKDETGWSEDAILKLLREAVREKEQTPTESATPAPANNQEQGTPDTA